MKNGIQSGEILTLTAPSGGVVSGSPYLIGSLLVVAADTAAQDDPFPAVTVGVFDLPKVDDEAWTEGLKLYFDESEGLITLDDDSAANPLVGVAASALPPNLLVTCSAGAAGLTITNNVLTVVDYTKLNNATVTVTIDGIKHVLSEADGDFTAATGNTETADSLASAIDDLDGASAENSSAVITIQTAVGRVRLDGVAR